VGKFSDDSREAVLRGYLGGSSMRICGGGFVRIFRGQFYEDIWEAVL